MPPKRDPNVGTTFFTPESTATLQVPLTMTPEQTNVIFEYIFHKLEAEIAAVEIEARLR